MPEPIPLRPAVPVETPLEEVAQWLGDRLLDTRGEVTPTRPVVTGVTLSTLRVRPGDLYVAPAGSRAHGATYAGAAVEAGAVAVLTDPEGATLCAGLDVPVLV
ncbi:MAG: UDP-N-acetylmuramoyl-L-alanyl-D-glutamate--2,6-diaminopimelate ligase, partial [Nocardioidaceae bacterium]|nr:UDP-N-acetylmuramoyl-L-alanyl-D-glutamate--2,6-diaminopimelate ligase [Nocardioidaceae bacterium]